MSVIFLDTCAIINLIEKKIDSDFIKKRLGNYHTIVIGRHTLMECMKNYRNIDNLCKTFQYINSLDPEYTLTAGELFQIEQLKIKTKKLFANFCDDTIKKVISNFCQDPLRYYDGVVFIVEEYNKYINMAKKAWYPKINEHYSVYTNNFSGSEKNRLKKINQSSDLFEERIKNIFPTDENIARLYILFSRCGLSLTKDDIKHFLQNQSDYPAIRTYFRSIVLLGDNTINKDFPKKDKFTDAMQFIEASYCTTFVSSEKNLIDHSSQNCRGKKYNPDIELVDFFVFLQHLKDRM